MGFSFEKIGGESRDFQKLGSLTVSVCVSDGSGEFMSVLNVQEAC